MGRLESPSPDPWLVNQDRVVNHKGSVEQTTLVHVIEGRPFVSGKKELWSPGSQELNLKNPQTPRFGWGLCPGLSIKGKNGGNPFVALTE